MPVDESPEILLADMVENARVALRHASGLTREAFNQSRLHQDAIIRRLEIVGEAARFVDVDTRNAIDVPWPKIVSMRHILAHEYDSVNLKVVWDVITTHAPAMIERVERYLHGWSVSLRPSVPLAGSPSIGPPRFIVFDGNEGCGKSTQAKLLRERLERDGRDVLLVRDPGTTRVGELVRGILLNPDHVEMGMRCEMLLYMAARAQMMRETIAPALEAGQWVISDRFVSSTLAYQLGGDGLTADEIRAVADIAIGHRWPDLTLIFDLPVEKSRDRVRAKYVQTTKTLFGEQTTEVKDRIEQRPIEYHEQVRRNYLSQAQASPDRYRVIDGDRDPQRIHIDVLEALGIDPQTPV
ncbi:MAG TPA: dTMP kinase [Tepidisphaeraceae bacterium]|jgi:dTMP kinase